MKIDPIYLLAPKRVPSMPTRRAFLIAGGTFVLGFKNLAMANSFILSTETAKPV